MLRGRRVVLGVTGSIASYKAADLASRMTQAGAEVDIILTEAATRFVAPLTFRSLTQRPVYSGMYDPQTEVAEQHVALARAADAVVIAPASATTIARIAHGLADDLLSLTVLATLAPVVIAPAMDSQMYLSAAVQANVATLKERGCLFVGPDTGRLASGYLGPGRLATPEAIIGAVDQALARRGDLVGRRIVVSAGGTQEPIDPVRYVGNRSTGKMGFAVAEAARDRGAEVTLVSGPVALADPYGVAVVHVRRATEMRDAVMAACERADAVIMAAAVADFQPEAISDQKIKKRVQTEDLTLRLVRTPDILAELRDRPLVKVGFAAETQDLLANATEKLEHKNLDLIAANDVTAPASGFGADTNSVTLIERGGAQTALPLMAKYEVANAILDRVARLLEQREAQRGSRG